VFTTTTGILMTPCHKPKETKRNTQQSTHCKKHPEAKGPRESKWQKVLKKNEQ